jgi:hypothetical protein
VFSGNPSALLGVTVNMSRSTAAINDNLIGHDNSLSAITHKLNVSGHMWILTCSFLLLLCENCALTLSATLSSILYKCQQ